MNGAEWETSARTLAVEQAARITPAFLRETAALGLACPTATQLRQALVEVHRLLMQAPSSIQQRYKKIDETWLRMLVVDGEARLEEGSLAWCDGDVVIAAAVQARALDHYLLLHGDVRGKPTDAATDYLCPATHMHVIPRPAAEQPAATAVGTPTFRRRGLVWHRLIPATIGDYTIDIHWYRDLSLSFRRDGAKVLGSLFDGLSLTADSNFENFVAAAAPCDEEDRTLAEHVDAAYSGDVTIALWPELTMPPARREKLVAALRQRAENSAPAKGPSIIAAGSWHEVSGANIVNRMHLLNSLGQPRFHHDKSLPMESNRLGVEELSPSYRIPVLITDDALLAFAICRDFCEAQLTNVYIDLDVDMVVVPSYGDENTIIAHRQQAHDLAVDPGTRVFVVQQIVPDEVATSGAGYILAPETNTATAVPRTMVAYPPSEAHPLSFKKV